jgi:hypothetical protein
VEQLQLLLRLQVQHLRQQLLRTVGLDEATDVHVDERGHQELTVEPIHYASVSGDHVAEILSQQI